MLNVCKRGSGLFEAVPYRLRRETRPVLYAPETLLLGSGNDFTIADKAGGRVTVIGVKPEDDHTQS
jgi:hypothetical protein